MPGAVPIDGERWVDAGVVGPRSHEFATGLATWYLERAEAAMPLLPEGREGTVTRQGGGQTEYDEMVQPGVVGMEVGRSTDGAAGAGTTTAGSTDTTATNVGVVGMEVERSTDGAVGLGRDATGVTIPIPITTTGSTDTAAASAGVAGTEVERPADGAAGDDDDGLSTDTAAAGRGRGRGRPNGKSKARVRAKKRKKQEAGE